MHAIFIAIGVFLIGYNLTDMFMKHFGYRKVEGNPFNYFQLGLVIGASVGLFGQLTGYY